MKYIDKRKVGDNIRLLREKRGLKQKEVADLIDAFEPKENGNKFNVNTLGRWELGETSPSLQQTLYLCEILGCELGYLLDEPDYECKTKGTSFIKDETGLSEDSINNICDAFKKYKIAREMSEPGYDSFVFNKEVKFYRIINLLSMDDKGKDLAIALCDVLFADFESNNSDLKEIDNAYQVQLNHPKTIGKWSKKQYEQYRRDAIENKQSLTEIRFIKKVSRYRSSYKNKEDSDNV